MSGFSYSTEPGAVERRAQPKNKAEYDRIRANYGLAPVEYRSGPQTDAEAEAEADEKGCSATNPEQKLLDLRRKITYAAKAKKKKYKGNKRDTDESEDVVDDEEEDAIVWKPKSRYTSQNAPKSNPKSILKRKRVEIADEDESGLQDDEDKNAVIFPDRRKAKMAVSSYYQLGLQSWCVAGDWDLTC